MDVDLTKPITCKSIIAPIYQTQEIQEIKLRTSKLSWVFLAYLRQVKKAQYFSPNSPYQQSVKLTKVVDLEFELSILKTYCEVVQLLSDLLEFKDTLEDDQ